MARARHETMFGIGGIATGLKNLSKTLNVPVMALHQLNRSNAGFGRESRRRTIFDIRASGEIAENGEHRDCDLPQRVARPDFWPLAGTAEER